MSKKLITLVLFSAVFALCINTMTAQGIKLDRSVIGSGGMVGSTNNSNMKMSGITGQVAIEKRSSDGPVYNGSPIDLWQGFWVPVGNYLSPVDENTVSSDENLSNYPNPFNSSTTIRYNLHGTANVTIKIFDVAGNMVKALYSGIRDTGSNEIQWNGKDENNNELSSGSYIYELTATPADIAGNTSFKAFTLRNKMVIVK